MAHEHAETVARIPTHCSSLSVRVYRDLSGLESIAEQWDNLAGEICRRSPSTSYAWVASHLQSEVSGDTAFACLAASDSDQLVGVLPLGMRTERVLGADVTKLVQPGARRLNSVDAVICPGAEQDVLGAFREALDELCPGWYSLEFNWVDYRSPLAGSNGYMADASIVRHAAGLTSAVDTRNGDWDKYFAGVSPSLRKTVRRAYRKLADTSELQVEMLSGPTAYPANLERFMKVEDSGWKGAAGTALARNPQAVAVHRVLAERLYQRGMLEWHFLRTEGTDIAAQMAVRAGRTIYVYRIGYNEAYHQYSPGVLMREQTLARAFADRDIDSVNFMTHRPWHIDWRAKQYPIYHVWIYPRRVRSVVAGVWPKLAWRGLRKVPGVRAVAAKIRGEHREGSAIQGRQDFLRLRRRAKR